jgi:hypothetical protein
MLEVHTFTKVTEMCPSTAGFTLEHDRVLSSLRGRAPWYIVAFDSQLRTPPQPPP